MVIERLSTASKDDTTRQAKDLMQESLVACIEADPPAWTKQGGGAFARPLPD